MKKISKSKVLEQSDGQMETPLNKNLLFIKYSIWIFQIHMYISQLLSISNIKIFKQYFTLNPRNEVKLPL